MNILHLTNSFSSGGRRTAIETLAHELNKFGINNCACSQRSISNLDKEHIKNTGGFKSILSLDCDGHYIFRANSLIKKLESYCKHNKIDLLHTHDAASQITAAFLKSKKIDIPHVHTFHRSLGLDTVGFKNKARNLFSNKNTDVITVGSKERKTHYLNNNFFVKNKLQVIPFGVKTDLYIFNEINKSKLLKKYKIHPDAIILGSVGHFGKEKGIDFLLHAFSLLLRKTSDKNITLVIIGSGTSERVSKITNLAKDLGITDKVIFIGYTEQAEKFYSLFDIYIHAAREEAFGLVLIEAMAAGLPAIASNIGGIKDIVRHEESGILYEHGNPETLALSIHSIIYDKQKLLKFGKAGHKIATTKYTATEYAKNFLTLYKTLTNM